VPDRSATPGAGAPLEELLTWLDAHTDYERAAPTRLRAPTLERITELCRLPGDPQTACPILHLTGTNGKGSTARLLTELLLAQGLTVGTYTSPNLATVNERLTRNGEPVGDDELAELLESLRLLEGMTSAPPSRFELLTAAAFRFFADSPVDVAVVEVGLGGRWDATNVADGDVVAVTNVSYDHVEALGPTLHDIAGEKSGIVKPGSHLVVGETDPGLARVFADAADRVGARAVWRRGPDFDCDVNQLAVGGRLIGLRTPGAAYEELYLPLHGAHQGDNAALAVACAEAFFGAPLAEDTVAAALSATRVPGRLEVVGRSPLVVLDGAHNVAGAQALAGALAEMHPEGGIVGVVGMLHGRDPSAVFQALAAGGVRTVVSCTAPSPRAIPAGELAEAARAVGLQAQATDSALDALTLALGRAGAEDTVVVTGSLYVVAEARSRLVTAGDTGSGSAGRRR